MEQNCFIVISYIWINESLAVSTEFHNFDFVNIECNFMASFIQTQVLQRPHHWSQL